MYILYRMNIMAYEKTFDLLDLAIWMQSTREGVSLSDIMNAFKYQEELPNVCEI